MALLNTKQRKKLPAQAFGIPSQRKFPMNDKSHAANAEGRATQMVNAGLLSPSTASKIRAKAKRVLGK